MAKEIQTIGVLTSGGDAPRYECSYPCGSASGNLKGKKK